MIDEDFAKARHCQRGKIKAMLEIGELLFRHGGLGQSIWSEGGGKSGEELKG